MKKIVLFALVAVMVCLFSVSLAATETVNSENQLDVDQKKEISPKNTDSTTEVESANDSVDEGYKKPAKAIPAAVPAEQPTITDLAKKFTGLDQNGVTNLGAVKKGNSLSFTPGSLANYYLFVFVNGQWVAYKIPDGATNINIPVDSPAAFVGGSNTPIAGALAL
jgi:hypothetical protein